MNQLIEKYSIEELYSLFLKGRASLGELEDLLDLCESTKNAYFWRGSNVASCRRRNEEEKTMHCEGIVPQVRVLKRSVKIAVHTYQASHEWSESCSNCYRTVTCVVNGQKTTLTRIKSLVRYAREAVAYLASLPAVQAKRAEVEAEKRAQRELEALHQEKVSAVIEMINIKGLTTAEENRWIEKLAKEKHTKASLLSLAEREGIEVYKSWNKAKIIAKIAKVKASVYTSGVISSRLAAEGGEDLLRRQVNRILL